MCHPRVNTPECLSKSELLFGRVCRGLRAPRGGKSNVASVLVSLCPSCSSRLELFCAVNPETGRCGALASLARLP